MTTEKKIQKLKEFLNEKEFREFLIDFLKKSGFKNVIHTHRYGSPEQGKDIIAEYHHDIEGEDLYAFVVKYGRIGGGTTDIEMIKGQIKQSFEYPYQGINGEKIKVNKVKVVTNEYFTSGAQSQISGSPELKIYNNFGFWWNETLIPIIDEKYPDFWLPGDMFSKEYSKVFTKKLRQEIEIRDLSIQKIDDKKIQKLLDIFIEPKLTVNIIEKGEDSQKSFKQKYIHVNEITDITENLLLSGEQGSGKSKILNTIACRLGEPASITEHQRIPVKLKAPYLRALNYDIEKAISNEINELTENYFTPEIISCYKVVLFIDDLDLLKSTEKEELVKQVKNYCEIHETNYVLTFRKSDFYYDKEIKNIKIHNFSQNQTEAFIIKFFEGSDRGNRFIQILRESNILTKLPTTPLTITLISLLYDENTYEIPATLSDIYLDFVSILLGKLEIKNKTDLLILNIKRRLFSSLALEMLDNKVFEISLDKFTEFINSFLDERGYNQQSPEEIIDIIENSGLLYKDDFQNIGFKQQAFIEFLASLEIYHNKRETHYSKLIENFNDINWQSVAIFYAGHSKELVNMIDDVVGKSPNNDLKDWFINVGGMGYLAQALYLTTPKERKKLVIKSVENLVKAFYKLKDDSAKEDEFLYEAPLPMIAGMINYWFNENFKSITLTRTLIDSFNELFDLQEKNFDSNFKLLMISTTLMNPYINESESFSKLFERKEFMEHPLLPLIADMALDSDKINEKNVSEEIKNKIRRTLHKKREYLKQIFREPAYRFNDTDFTLIEDK